MSKSCHPCFSDTLLVDTLLFCVLLQLAKAHGLVKPELLHKLMLLRVGEVAVDLQCMGVKSCNIRILALAFVLQATSHCPDPLQPLS